MHEELFTIAQHYGDNCSNCKEICCANMILDIDRENIKAMSKYLRMQPVEFRRKYTKLYNNLFKEGEIKSLSAMGKKQAKRNSRVLVFNTHPLDSVELSNDQRTRLIDTIEEMSGEKVGNATEEVGFSLCPFYDEKTHMCTVHSVRPTACQQYPFNIVDKETIDIRKVNICVISTNFLRRFQKFVEKADTPNAQKYAQQVKDDIHNGGYSNHYHLPLPIVLFYIDYECKKLGIRTSPKFERISEIALEKWI